MEDYSYIYAKTCWMSGIEVLELAKQVAEIGAKEGNPDSLMKEGQYGEYLQIQGDPKDGDSYFLAVVPALYSLGNGIEQILKAFNYAGHPGETVREVPTFAKVLQKFHVEFSDQDAVIEFVDKYTTDEKLPKLFASFLAANNMSSMEFYNTRRNIKNTSFKHIIERYPNPYPYSIDEGKAFFAELADDINAIQPLIESLHTAISENGVPRDIVAKLRRNL